MALMQTAEQEPTEPTTAADPAAAGTAAAAADAQAAVERPTADGLIGSVEPSPAGPAVGENADWASLPAPPAVPLPRALQVLRFNQRQIQFVFRWRRELGDVFRAAGIVRGRPAFTCHPDHVKSLFTANPADAPSLTAESPLLPIVGPNSVLTANGPRHMRQRKLLLPAFHGEAIGRYTQMIEDVAEREIARWPVGRPFQLAPRMQDITLDVIMAGILGVDSKPRRGTPEYGLRAAIKYLAQSTTLPIYQLAELMNYGHDEPVGLQKQGVAILNRYTYPVIAERRRAGDLEERDDILSTIMRARTEEGEALSDREVRDELLTVILAGFETTANSLAWAWERLTRNPVAHDRLRDAVRSDTDAAENIEAVIHETMRSRPVIPAIGRRVMLPWRLGDHSVPAGSPVAMSILLVHHREDLYPDPFSYRPERWFGHKPGTYEWIPFGGGTRRCLGALLAMAEQRVVLRQMVEKLDVAAVDPEPEHALHRNVTMIPRGGARVVIRSRLG